MKQACVQDLGERRVSERLSIEGATSVVGRTFWFWFCSRAGRASEARACVRACVLAVLPGCAWVFVASGRNNAKPASMPWRLLSPPLVVVRTVIVPTSLPHLTNPISACGLCRKLCIALPPAAPRHCSAPSKPRHLPLPRRHPTSAVANPASYRHHEAHLQGLQAPTLLSAFAR